MPRARPDRTLLPRFALAALALAVVAAGNAAHGQHGSPPQPAQVAFANSGDSAAQPAFQRGVSALHNFAFRIAVEAFRQAQAIDPAFALAYWGEAMAHAHLVWGDEDVASGRRVLQTLQARSGAVQMTARERDYLAAAEALFGPGDREARTAAFETRMRQLHQAYPDDVEAGAFHALALIRRGPQHAEAPLPARLRAAAILEPLLRQHPRHPGVLHYLIHAYDDPVHARLAVPAARLYEQVAVKSPHALHMPSHVYLRLGLWDDVARANATAYAASVDPGHRDSGGPDLHALEWLHYAELQRGRRDAAAQLLQTMHRHGDSGNTRAARAATRMAVRAIVAGEAWDQAHLPKESPYLDLFLSHANAIWASGLGAVARGDEDAGRQAIAKLEELRRPAINANLSEWADRLVVMMKMIEAESARRRGDVSLARTMFEDAVRIGDGAEGTVVEGDQSLPNPAKPVRELYGEALLGWGEADAAQSQFAAVLRRSPRRPAALLGLARALVARGDRAAAACRYAELGRIWHAADAGLPELAEARQQSAGAQECPTEP